MLTAKEVKVKGPMDRVAKVLKWLKGLDHQMRGRGTKGREERRREHKGMTTKGLRAKKTKRLFKR